MKKLVYWIVLIIGITLVSIVAREATKTYFKQKSSVSNPFPKASPLHEIYKTFAEQLFAVPEINEHFKNISSADQAFVIAMKLSTNGMRRLDDDSLVNRIRLVGMLFERVNVETCAAMGATLRSIKNFNNSSSDSFCLELSNLVLFQPTSGLI